METKTGCDLQWRERKGFKGAWLLQQEERRSLRSCFWLIWDRRIRKRAERIEKLW